MIDILSIVDTLLLLLEKEGALLVHIQFSIDLTIEKFRKLVQVDSSDKYTNILAPTKCWSATSQKYIAIWTDLEETQIS